MSDHRLYIIEGLPCSGKSSAAKFVAGLTGGRFFDEDCGDHPADWEFTAFIPDNAEEFDPTERTFLTVLGERLPGGLAVPLGQLSRNPGLYKRAFQYKIYDCLDWENEHMIILDKWRSFAEYAQTTATNDVFVFNCVLRQNPMCETMMRFNFDSADSLAFIREICDIIAPLDPMVIYLHNTDIRSAVKNAAVERGEEWLSAVIDYHCTGAYGQAHLLSGFDGYIDALEERQRRELEFLPQLPVTQLLLNDPQRDWDKAYQQLRREICGDVC